VIVPPLAVEQAVTPVGTGVPAIVDDGVSAKSKPVPVTVIDAPTGPEAGEIVSTCGTMYNVADAVCVGDDVSFTVIVSVSPVNVVRTVKEAAEVSV
jgi:hypothetical protein